MMKSATAVKAKIKNKAGGSSDKSQIMLRIYLMERLLERVSLSRYRDNYMINFIDYCYMVKQTSLL